jgi:hypothetical protein
MDVIQRNPKYPMADFLAMSQPFSDPLNINFKFMIDYSKPYGLFAPESVQDSALAYLKRIGETARYELLNLFIDNFKNIIKNHEYLLLGVDGIDAIIERNQNEQFYLDDNDLIITTRETIDMKIQSLLNAYRYIWFDDVRGVEVLPVNLREFDCYFVLYALGYYNHMLYDDTEDNPEGNILPTVKKIYENLTEERMGDIANLKFNCVVINVGCASIDLKNSSKGFFDAISNDPNDLTTAKNSIGMKFKFARVNGIFNNLFGDIDMTKLFVTLAIENKTTPGKKITVNSVKEGISGFGKNVVGAFSKAGALILDDLKNKRMEDLKNRGERALKRLTVKDTFIGNALENLQDANYLAGMVTNTIDKGLNLAEDYLVNKNITRLNNLVSMNFADNLYDVYQNFTQKPYKGSETFQNEENKKAITGQGAQMIEQQDLKNDIIPRHYKPDAAPNVKKGVEIRQENIYTRRSF